MRRAALGALRVRLIDGRVLLLIALALLTGTLAYQAPPTASIPVGWLGDQFFLPASEGQSRADTGSWYGDELTPDAATGRSRWTRQTASVVLPGMGASGDIELTMRMQGWPDDVLAKERQPQVTVVANGTPVGTFSPSTRWQQFRLIIPAALQRGGDLRLELRASDTFTSTQRHADMRPKGVRVANISLEGNAPGAFVMPEPLPLLWLALGGVLMFLVLLRLSRQPTGPLMVAVLLICGLAMALSVVRAWTVALLPWMTVLLFAALLVAMSPALVRRWVQLGRRYTRGRALGYGLVAAALAWLFYVAARFALTVPLPGADTLHGSLLDVGILGMTLASAAALVVVYGRAGLPRACQALVDLLASRWGGLVALVLFMALWVGYEASVIASMPWVGHADYADNAVVARNLVHGRGAVVDYVTQFYKLYPGITHPQETWPLLQPVWIAMAFMLFGISNWAAKIPNLVFITLLALLIYRAGARLWDRRVGLVAAILVLTSQFFFYLVMYTTTDLAFTLFAFGAVYSLYQAIAGGRRTVAPEQSAAIKEQTWHLPQPLSRSAAQPLASVILSAILTGLLLLQKPGSGVLIAFGMALWFAGHTLYQARRARARQLPLFAAAQQVALIVLWGVVALAILAPYLVRNVQLFDKPFYSTESYDAWVLGYGDWEDIYKVYTPEAGLSETGGTPNRSWLLRWGFDRTLAKLDTQVTAVRNYLLPPWDDMPLHLSDVFSGGGLLYGAGAWLALVGFMAALRTRRALIMLLLAAFVPYTLFLITYWHANEQRYFVVLMPWLALLAAYALWRGYDHLARADRGSWAPLGLALVLAAIFATVQPSWSRIADKVETEPRLLAADLQAYTWIRDNTPPDTVVMTRVPWQFNWAAGRPALMMPFTLNRETFFKLARYYNARYLVFDVAQRPDPRLQQFLEQLVNDPALGFAEVYRSGDYGWKSTIVYRFPENYANVPELRP